MSIVMNCYNGEKYLNEAIDSVYNQTYQNWEIIFWDNASNDNSAVIAKSYDSKLKYFKGEKTVSLGLARNMALDECNGDYVAFLDVDDMWLKEKLEIQINNMQSDPEIILCYSDGFEMNYNKKTKNKFSYQKNLNFYDGMVFDKLIISNFIYWQTVIINKSLARGELCFNDKLESTNSYNPMQ